MLALTMATEVRSQLYYRRIARAVTDTWANCAAVLVGQAVSPANCEIETMAGETACPTTDASQRGWNTKAKPAGNCSPERRKDLTWKPEPKRYFKLLPTGVTALSASIVMSDPMWEGLHV
jgi:hypothetical protein